MVPLPLRLVASLVAALLLSAAPVGCGGSGGGGGGVSGIAGPQLVASTPGDGAEGVDGRATVLLDFDQAMDPATAAAGIAVTAAGGAPIAGVTFGGTGTRIEVRAPAAGEGWGLDETIEVAVTNALRSTRGLAARSAVVRFSTTPLARPAVAGGARSGAASVALEDGRILTAGGEDGTGSLAVADLFDPETGAFAAAAPMNTPRRGHALVRLRDRRVLAVGGYDDAGTALDDAEIWSPATGTWRALPATLAATRVLHAAFALPSGRVAIVGGRDTLDAGSQARTSVEIFDPRDEVFSTLAAVTVAEATWAQLEDGRLLAIPVAAGVDATVWDFDDAAPVADPVSNRPATTGSARAVARLRDGRVLVAGGLSGGAAIAATAIYDPAADSFAAGPSLTTARSGATAVLLASGKVAVIGGATTAGAATGTIEVFDPSAPAAFATVTAPPLAAASAVALPSGALLVTSSRSSPAGAASAHDQAHLFGAIGFGAPAAAHVTGVEPAGPLDAAAPEGAIRVRFSRPMDPATLVPANFTVTGPRGAIAFDVEPAPDARSCFLLPLRSMPADAEIEVECGAGLAPAGGAAFDATFGAARTTFRTAVANPLPDGAIFAADGDAILRLVDRDGDGAFSATEATTFWAPTSTAFVLQRGATSRDGQVFVGDSSTADAVLRLVDRNGDGDALDADEETVFFDDTSALGNVLSAPTAAIAPDGAVLVANAGAGGTPDGIFRVLDADGDGTGLGASDEVSVFDDAQTFVFPHSVDVYGVVGFVKTPAPFDVHRYEDLDGDGDVIDGQGGGDAGERTVFHSRSVFTTFAAFTPGFGIYLWASQDSATVRLERVTAAGVATAAFNDPVAPGGIVGSATSIETTADGSVWIGDITNDEVHRLFDANGDGDFDDAGEATTPTSGLTLTDTFYLWAGRAPGRARLLALPAAGEMAITGVAAPVSTVRASVNGGAEVTAIADALGRFEVALGSALQAGDAVTLVVEATGGISIPLEVAVE